MGIRFSCPNGHKLHVKTFLAGKRGVCPECGTKFVIPGEEQPQPAVASAQPVGGATAGSGAGAPGPARLDTGLSGSGPSVIIPIAGEESSPAAPSASPSAVPPPLPPPTVPAGLSASPQDIPDFASADAPTAPAVRYAAQRERNRRKQFTTAVLLLLAVIMLAGVLIWVLRRSIGNSTDESSGKISLFDFRVRPYVVLSEPGSSGTFLKKVSVS